MAQKNTPLESLGSLLQQKTNVNDELFCDLSDAGLPSPRRQRANKELKSRVEVAMGMSAKVDFPSAEDMVRFKEYCRNFAAFLLVTDVSEPMFRDVFLRLIDLLLVLAPSFKTELRGVRNSFKAERAYVSQLGFGWEDLKLPFIPDRFTNAFLTTEISVKPLPERETVVVEKEIIVEKEVVVEKEKVVYIPVEKEPEKDMNYFGKEGQTVEFKSSFVNSCNDKQQIWNICKAVCAFLNADGGVVYIGVDNSGHAIPASQNGHLTGIHEDIAYLKRAQRLPYGKNDTDSYCLHIKYAIVNKFREGNDVSKFSGDIIVSETDNNNVVKIEVRKSKYCVVYLEGIAYQRSGASSPEMDTIQIEQRTQDLMSVSKDVLYKIELSRAIKEKKQVVLYSYRSANGGSVSNRYVEPVHFVCDETSIVCFDTVKQATRQFKLSRIGDVKVLETPWSCEDQHEQVRIDVFGWTQTSQGFELCLDMDMPAMTSMMERHPNVTKDDFKKLGGGIWRMETTVYSLEPVVGFYLGLAEHIDIQESKDAVALKKRIREYLEEHVLNRI